MRKVVVGLVAFVVIGILVTALLSGPEGDSNVVFSATLADPDLYQNGVYHESFTVDGGQYYLRFVPNGDSPKAMTITLAGQSFESVEEFVLEGTLQGTEPATYYTWDYIGHKQILIPTMQTIDITIDPHGDIMGPVSVQIVKTA